MAIQKCDKLISLHQYLSFWRWTNNQDIFRLRGKYAFQESIFYLCKTICYLVKKPLKKIGQFEEENSVIKNKDLQNCSY